MKVIDFDKSALELYVSEKILLAATKNLLIIGIADGGVPIANIVRTTISQNLPINVTQRKITCRRPSTKLKKKSPARERIIKSFFSATPRFILDKLRVIEHKWLSKRKPSNMEREVLIEEELCFENYDTILIIDDAVDTGASLKHIYDFILKNTLDTQIITLAVTTTQRRPIHAPDFSLYNNVLVRFPWSLDAKSSV